MKKSIRINEYYDLFDVKKISSVSSIALTDINGTIKNHGLTNPFHGFSNWTDAYSLTANGVNDANGNRVLKGDIEITGQHKAPQAINTINIIDNYSSGADIMCYPPNVSVPYWSKVIFRNFDYNYKNTEASRSIIYNLGSEQTFMIEDTNLPFVVDTNGNYIPVPKTIIIEYTAADEAIDSAWKNGTTHEYLLWGVNTATYESSNTYPTNFPSAYRTNLTNVMGTDSHMIGNKLDFDKAPLFLKFDEYHSRSKVIFSGCDKTRNPDIEFDFNYHRGQMEPIKLNLSLSAGVPTRIGSDSWNQNLTKQQMETLLSTCYWCIEWIYEPESGN